MKVYVRNLGGTDKIVDVAELADVPTKAGNETITGLWTFNANAAGVEGGEIHLSRPPSGSTLAGDVIVDINTNTLRVFEGGGATRGFSIDLTGCAAGAGTRLFESGSWTPGVSFGGGTTGITYSTQVGRYTKIGNLVWLQGLIVLSSKGSSTGNARITGLPVASSSVASNFSGMGLLHNSMSSAGPFYNYAGASSSVLEVLKASVNTTIVADQTDFSNTTALTIGFMYMTD